MSTDPEPDDRRRRGSGRRETDLTQYRLDALERLPEDLSRAVGVRMDELRAWITDERQARRHHDAEIDDRLDELRRHVDQKHDDLAEKIETKFEECGKSIASIGTEQRAGRRAILLALIAAAASIIGTIIGTGGHP